MIKVIGQIRAGKSGVKIHFSPDLAHLWNWYIRKETGMILYVPKFPAKIGLYRPDSYHTKKPNEAELGKLKNKKIEVTLDPSEIKVILSRKGYWVSFLDVECKNVESVINRLGLSDNFTEISRPHMSIANGKYFVK